MLGLTFSSNLDSGSYIISTATTASKKIGALIHFMKFFLLRLLCISMNLPYAHAWNTVVTSGLVPLVATWNCQTGYKKKIYRTVGPSLAASIETLADCQNVVCLSLFYRHYFGRCSSELAQLVPLPFSRGRSIRYSDRLHDFSVSPFLDVTGMAMSTFLSSHSQIVEFFAYRMLFFDL